MLLCLTLISGLLPNVALAADADGVRYQENADVAVTYDDVVRTHATVRYHKPGAQVDSYNIIFLVDTSVQGKDSFESFEKMMVESGSDTIFDSTSNNLVSLINYTTTAETNRVNNDGIYALMSQVIHGAGTANEITALDAALAEVKSLKNSERSSYPTIVFWVLGKDLVEVGNAAFESKLKALHDALNMDGSADTDALITWQLGTDTPNELLKQYATEYTGTHDSVPAKAAYASNNAAAFRKAMRDGLENIAYDHYHDLTYKLKLSESNNGTSIVKKVTDVYVESARGSSQIMATPSEDNKSVAVQIDHLRRQTDYDIVFELDLNADVYEAQTVLQGITIDAQSAGQSGGVHAGVFDELTANLSTTFPEAVVDRAYREISFDLNGGTGNAVEPIKALPGQRVVLPDGRGLMRRNDSFGGWDAADTADQGKVYQSGSVLAMPENDMNLKAAYGHMEVELDVEKVAASTLDNHLDYVKPPRYSQMNGILTSVIPTSYWGKIVGIYVDDRTFNRYSYNKSTREVDVNTLVADDLSIVAAWHLGTIQDDIDSRVIGYLTPNGNYYDLHIAGPDGVIAPENSAGLFWHPLDQYFTERVTTIHLGALNTENVKDMNDMFSERTVLTELELGPNFVTTNVTNMSGMFSRCYKLQKVDVSGFDTEHVTDMSFMFSECKALEGIDVSHFKTSRVESFRWMFYRCWKVLSLSLENFDTSSATSMDNMFGESGLETLDLSSFDTRNVTYMSGMFGWSPLTEINFGENFDTSKVTHMDGMFKNTKLISLRLPDKFVADSVKDISEMFSGCARLRDLDLNNFHPTSKVTTNESVFSNCSSLESLDLSIWDESGVTKMTYAFAGTTGLTDLKIDTWRLKSAKEMTYAFSQSAISSFDFKTILDDAQPESLLGAFQSSNIEHADLTGVDVSKVIYIDSLFSNCTKLKTANLSNCDFASLTRSYTVFTRCTALESVNLSNTKMPNITNMASWFGSCTNLTSVDFTGFVSEKCEKFGRMFSSCTSLTNVDFGSDFSFANGTELNDMFNGCTSLESVSGLNFNTSNKAASFNNMFKGCSKLESVTFGLLNGKASFPSLKTMTAMFDGCNQLTNVGFGGTWTVGDLTNTNQMFRNCTSLKNITLDFDEIRAPQGGFSTTDMFTGVPADATLTTTVSMTNGLQAIRDAFDSRSTRAQTMNLPADLDEDLTEQCPVDDPDEGDSDNLLLDSTTEESMDGLLNRSESSITLLSGSSLKLYTDDVNKPTASDANITVHPTATKVGDKVTYRIRAKYVGDNGAQSSLVDIALPLPEFMTAEPDELDIKVGNLISDGAVIKGGYVVGEPEYDAVNKMLRAKINALASSCYIDFNITYTIDQNGKNVGDYYYWDATALAVSETGSVNSNTYRLWQAIKADPNPGTTYQFKYDFTGDVPADVTLPAVTSRTENEQITVASAPTGYPSYYTFTGWKRSDTGAMVEPGTGIEMPAENLTLTGIWTLNQANVPEVTVQYQYTGSVPADAPAAPDTSTAKVTSTYYPNTNALHSYSQLRYKLGNTVNGTFTFLWRPTLTIDGTEVALTTSDNGKTYTDNANTYRIPASDVLDLEQFRTAAALGQNIVITYTAAWEPFRGTVQYNANGGKYTAAGNQTVVDRANVAFNEAYTLKEIGSEIDKIGFEPYADNISFLGWSTAPSGGAILSNDANPASPIKTDGQVITLYARWYVNNVPHGVALNLTNVTAEDQQTTAVSQGTSYTNKLTVKSGYIMKTVSVLMGETDITERAYNVSTGEINIAAVTGDVIITATAEPDGSDPNPPTPKPDDKDHDNRPRPNPTPTPVEPSVTDPKVTGVADLLDTETHVAFMHGYDTGYFGPNDSLTRAQACQMFYNLLLNKDVTVTTSFSDVSEDAWYYTAVNALASLGIVRGIGNSKFEPERSITRAEFTAIATRFAKADNRNALKFRDVSTDDWFYGCVLTAVNYGWITGMDEYTFQPNEKISRAQAAAIVNRMLARSADQSYANNENVRRFPDVPTSHWAFYQVMEASNGHGHSYDKNGSEIWTELYEASSKAS